jgi:indole-3-glycerol phosphate synthase
MEARRGARAGLVSLLEEILATKKAEVEHLRTRGRSKSSRRPLDALQVLRRHPGEPLRLIAEVKLRSPSAGALSRKMSPAERAAAYVDGGASMVSVLCDARYFDGAWEHLAAARERLDRAGCTVPLLAKEFIIDETQIQEARDRGADAVLLIARLVDAARLSRLARTARAEGLEPLVEVVDEPELEAALAADARVIGVNARDLDSLAMDRARATRVCGAIPPEAVAVHFSGLSEPQDIAVVARGRADAALVGEALMREDDPRPRLRAMLSAANSAKNG